jgi:hypothetical protein
MKNLAIVPLMAAMIGCAAAPEEIAANKAEVQRASQECIAQNGLVVLSGNSKRAKRKVICADEHMMAMWREQGANCARRGGRPNFYGNYKGMRVVFSDCHINYYEQQKDKK